MAQLRTYRVWYHDGSARLVTARDRAHAKGQAEELAHLDNAPVPPADQPLERQRYIKAVSVKKIEDLTPTA